MATPRFRFGSAFRNRDGSLNAILDAMPTNGTLHIRPFRVPDGGGARLEPAFAEAPIAVDGD